MTRATEVERARLLADRQLAIRRSAVGLGLLAAPIIGFAPLRDALTGRGSFEEAVLRFLACVVVCLIASSAIGRLLAGSPADIPAAIERDAEAAAAAEKIRQAEAGNQ